MVLILSPAALASATWIVGATRKLDRSNSACSPSACQHRPDWAANTIGKDKPPCRTVAPRGPRMWKLTGLPAENDLGHSAYDRLRIPRDRDQRPGRCRSRFRSGFESLMGSPIHWVAPEKIFLGARYEINQIGRASGIENWRRSVDSNPNDAQIARTQLDGTRTNYRCAVLLHCWRIVGHSERTP